MSQIIPVNEPLIGERESEYVMECLRTGWISSAGRFIKLFEEAWAEYCGRRYGIAMSNGTVVLEAAVAVLDLQPGDEVIMPTFTIISCAQAITRFGGVPVLVDSDPDTWCMDVTQVEAKITSRTRAIMPVHIYGHPVDMDPLLELAEKYHLAIIEDAAEVHGADYLTGHSRDLGATGEPNGKWQRCGSFGDMSTFSFYANKIITTGEGGMVLTDDSTLAQRLRDYRNLCFRPERRFYHTEIGNNYRLTNMQAAVGLGQVEQIDRYLAQKRWLGARYTEQLRDIPGIQLPIEKPWAKHVYWMYALVLDEATGLDANSFAQKLAALGVRTRPFFLGMHEQPVFHQMGLFQGEQYPIAERIARQGLYLPSGMALTEAQLDAVCHAVRQVVG
ncbi:MAG: DegT/DnrJ/EryC1/StrS family aminotransferase [Ardenticatenaceae bacterium]